MDPNENLEEQNELSEKIEEHMNNPDSRLSSEFVSWAGRLAELQQAMNEWLSKGGFLPDAWQRKEAK